MVVAKIIGRDGKRISLELNEEISEEYIRLLYGNKQPYADVKLIDDRNISHKQRKLIYALINDISKWSGYDPLEAKSVMKFYYEEMYGKHISFGHCSKSEANQMISLLIELVMKYGIQLKERYEYLVENNHFFYCCVKYRKCCICGKEHADIDHIETVGMGRNRRYVDHTKLPVEALCREHHNLRHSMPIKEFMAKFKIQPVFLSESDIKRLGISTEAVLAENRDRRMRENGNIRCNSVDCNDSRDGHPAI